MAMRMTVKHNLNDVLAKLDALADGVENVAMPRAINKLADQAQVAGFRKIGDLYQIGPRTMEQYATLKLANTAEPEAEITVKGKGFPLTAFKPNQTRAGVSVMIKGRRFTLPHTFLATMPSGHTGVFARGAYGGKGLTVTTGRIDRFQFGYRRRITRPRAKRTEIPINELFSWSPPDAFSNPDVTAAMQDRVEEQAAKVLAQEIRFATR